MLETSTWLIWILFSKTLLNPYLIFLCLILSMSSAFHNDNSSFSSKACLFTWCCWYQLFLVSTTQICSISKYSSNYNMYWQYLSVSVIPSSHTFAQLAILQSVLWYYQKFFNIGFPGSSLIASILVVYLSRKHILSPF